MNWSVTLLALRRESQCSKAGAARKRLAGSLGKLRVERLAGRHRKLWRSRGKVSC